MRIRIYTKVLEFDAITRSDCAPNKFSEMPANQHVGLHFDSHRGNRYHRI